MARVMAKTVGGPLDGLYFSVDEAQDQIVGMNGMNEVEAYVKQPETMREFNESERELFFADPNLARICEFAYVAGAA